MLLGAETRGGELGWLHKVHHAYVMPRLAPWTGLMAVFPPKGEVRKGQKGGVLEERAQWGREGTRGHVERRRVQQAFRNQG